MKDVSYFVALIAAGSTALLLALGSFVTMTSQSIAFSLGMPPDSETVKIAGYLVVALAWTLFLISYWIRNKGLSPRIVRADHSSKLAWGHRCLVVGHALALCIFFVKTFAFLMILPILGILLFYDSGIALIETARDRGGPGRRDA